ncbi:MAG: hypothetical protein IJX25_00345 [Clostridia bacterium]|nr:hypothetical protein [Clostridia bacterium]MBQ8792264.1 hypothetical protein [Clostridia bacterium]
MNQENMPKSVFVNEEEKQEQKLSNALTQYQIAYSALMECRNKYGKDFASHNLEYYTKYLEMLKWNLELKNLSLQQLKLFINAIEALVEGCKNGGYKQVKIEGDKLRDSLRSAATRSKFILDSLKKYYTQAKRICSSSKGKVNFEDAKKLVQYVMVYNQMAERFTKHEDEVVKPAVATANKWKDSVWERLNLGDDVLFLTEKGWEFKVIDEIENVIE